MIFEIVKDLHNDILCDGSILCISFYQPTYQEKIKNLTDSFGTVNVNLLGTEDLTHVIRALLHTE